MTQADIHSARPKYVLLVILFSIWTLSLLVSECVVSFLLTGLSLWAALGIKVLLGSVLVTFFTWLILEKIFHIPPPHQTITENTQDLLLTTYENYSEVERQQLRMKRSLEIEQILVNISSILINSDSINQAMTGTLEKIGCLTEADYAFLYLFEEHQLPHIKSKSWLKDGIQLPEEMASSSTLKRFKWTLATLNSGESVYFSDPNALPLEAQAEKEEIGRLKISQTLILPIHSGEDVIGFFGLLNFSPGKAWLDDIANCLKIVARLIGNIIAKYQVDLQLTRNKDFLRQIIDLNPNYIYAKNRQGRYTLANRALAEFYKTTPENMIGKTDADFKANREEAEVFQCDDLFAMETGQEKTMEIEIITDDVGQRHWISTIKRPILGDDGKTEQVLGIATDITDRKEALDRLAYDSLHDALTGLPNRTLFMDRLESAIKRSKRNKGSYTVLFLDFDHFKKINDSMGHLVGDRILFTLSQRIATCVRSADTVARFGGDEFVILLEDLNEPEEAHLITKRIMKRLTEPPSQYKDVAITSSVGVVFGSEEYGKAEEVLRDADIAMYRAKATGKARYVIFDESMRIDVIGRVQLESDLRKGIDRRELMLHYQPIMSLTSGKIIGLEALLRWKHPKRGIIWPNEFIPIAEETELIIPMGIWALREACKQMAAWNSRFPSDPPLTVSVNISSKQLSRRNFPNDVIDILESTGLDASQLKIEITESVFMENSETVVEVFNQLNNAGIQIYIDDFGMGYSSLGYLHRLPVHAIKIDRTFINGIEIGTGNLEIVQAIVRMTKNLGLELIAEGVENAEQQARLKEMGCELEQGFFISKPMAAPEIEKFFLN